MDDINSDATGKKWDEPWKSFIMQLGYIETRLSLSSRLLFISIFHECGRWLASTKVNRDSMTSNVHIRSRKSSMSTVVEICSWIDNINYSRICSQSVIVWWTESSHSSDLNPLKCQKSCWIWNENPAWTDDYFIASSWQVQKMCVRKQIQLWNWMNIRNGRSFNFCVLNWVTVLKTRKLHR